MNRCSVCFCEMYNTSFCQLRAFYSIINAFSSGDFLSFYSQSRPLTWKSAILTLRSITPSWILIIVDGHALYSTLPLKYKQMSKLWIWQCIYTLSLCSMILESLQLKYFVCRSSEVSQETKYRRISRSTYRYYVPCFCKTVEKVRFCSKKGIKQAKQLIVERNKLL